MTTTDTELKDAIASVEATTFLEEVTKNPHFRLVMQSRDKERIAAELARIGVKFSHAKDREDALDAIMAVDWSGLAALGRDELEVRMG